MATPAQIAANRANAQLSTGPRSAEGKSASRFNALKHGADAMSAVIPGEDPAEYQQLHDQYLARFQPESPDEHFHVSTMLDADWQRRRLLLLETELYYTLEAEAPGESRAAAILAATPAAKLLARTQRQLAAHQRAWYRAFSEFLRQRMRDDKEQQALLELASFRPVAEPPSLPADPAPEPDPSPAPEAVKAGKAVKSWPPVDEKTGKPLYFVG